MTRSRKQRTDLLRRVELFSGLSDRALGVIAERITEISFPAGRYIVRRGQIGTGFYVIESGRARVVRGSSVLARLGPGSFFGELSVLDQMPRTAHVVAEEPTICLALPSWEFTKLLQRHPKITLGILREVARRLRAVTELSHHESGGE